MLRPDDFDARFEETRERHRKSMARAEGCTWAFAGLMVALFLAGMWGVLRAADNYRECREAGHDAVLCLEHAVLGRALPEEGGER